MDCDLVAKLEKFKNIKTENFKLKLGIQLPKAIPTYTPLRWPPSKSCELAPCCAQIHPIPSTPIVFPVQISCCRLSRFCLESFGFHRFRDSLCLREKSCKLAPCCARFRRIPSTPIDSMAEISHSLMSQFCVDRIEFVHTS